MANYYIIKKEGREVKTESRAGAFEMWDCWGRSGVTVEEHVFDTDASGQEVHYVFEAEKITRRTSKTGEIKYHFKWKPSVMVV